MKPVDSVPEADLSCRSRPDDASEPDETAGQAGGTPSRSGWTQRPLQEIQDLIDRLAAVTQQLRHPGSASRDSSREPDADPAVAGVDGTLAGQAPQQAITVGHAQGGGAQQREGADIARDVGLALQVHAAG